MKIEVKEEVVRTVESVSIDAGSLQLSLHNNLKGEYDGLINSLSVDYCCNTLTLDFHSNDFGIVRVSFDPQNTDQKINIKNLNSKLIKLYKDAK